MSVSSRLSIQNLIERFTNASSPLSQQSAIDNSILFFQQLLKHARIAFVRHKPRKLFSGVCVCSIGLEIDGGKGNRTNWSTRFGKLYCGRPPVGQFVGPNRPGVVEADGN